MTQDNSSTSNIGQSIVQILSLAGLYFAAGQASLSLSASYGIVTLAVFAAEGFALAAVILFGTRLWPGIFLGQLLLALYNGLAWELAVGVSITNSLEAVIGATLFHRLALQPSLTKMRDVFGLLLLIFLVLQPVSATLGNLLLWLGGVIPTAQLAKSWFSWWFGNALGQVLTVPLALSFFSARNNPTQKWPQPLWLALSVIPASILIHSTISLSNISFTFAATVSLLIIIAAKNGVVMVNLATVIFAITALTYTQQMSGAFVKDGVILLLDLDIYLLSMALIGQFIAVLLDGHKQAQLAQQEALERLQKIADRLPGMVYQFRLNPDGSSCFPYASPSIYGIYRVSPEEVKENADKVFARVHPDDYRQTIVSMKKSAQTLTPWQLEYRVRFEDGTERWLFGNAIPKREQDGSVLWHGFITDITERKQLEAELLKSHNELQHYFEQPFIGMLTAGHDKHTIRVNQHFCDIVGYSKEEMQTIDWGKLTHPDDIAPNQAYLEQAIRGEIDTYQMEKRYIHNDGHIVYVDLAVKCVRNTEGKPDYFIGMMLDISERKRMENELKASEAFTVSILNSLTAHIVVLDAQGAIVMMNQAWQEFAQHNGLPSVSQNMPSYNYLEVCKKAIQQTHDREIAEILRGIKSVLLGKQQNFHAEYPCDSPNERRWFYMNVSPLQGARRGVVISHENITKRKLIEDALKASEAQSRSIIEISPVPMGLNDSLWNITFLNPAFTQTFGYDLSDIPTLSEWRSKAYPDPDYRQSVIHKWQAAYEAAEREHTAIAPLEVNVCCKNGTFKTVLISASTLSQAVNNVHLVVFYDITECKKAETDQRIAATVFESQEGMLITDANHVILKANQAFTRITGYNAAEIIGQNPRFLRSGRHDPAFYTALWQSINTTGAWQGEIWNRRKNGEIYPEWLTITAVKDNINGQVTHYVATHTDITERKATEEYISHLAFYDPLTLLPNRRLLQERIIHGIEACRRSGKKMAVLMLDLDQFKPVNDSFGHAAGDELLQQVAKRIKACAREADTVARLGGDEFVVLVEDISHYKNVAHIANAIIHSLSQPFTLTDNRDAHIGVSIGISIHPEHGKSPEALMDNADAALYYAKDHGRGRFAYFSEELTKKTQERLALESNLYNAIEQHQLRVNFQPQIDLKSGQIIGAEALVRWPIPDNRHLMPKDFIALAEETGLIFALGEWVLRETCTLGQQWLAQGLPPITLAVNISAYQFCRGDINLLVANVLKDTGFPAENLGLEITECCLMDNHNHPLDILNGLHAQGIRLAIDDFGTGYSSLACLKYFPIDILKIDQAFIKDIPFSEGDMAIAETIISMAHCLGFKVLAEGVETAEQLAFLREQGCDRYQGYLYSKAISADDFAALLASRQESRSPSA